MSASTERRSLLGRVHAAAKAAGLDDSTYRAKLSLHFGGRSSAKDLSDAELIEAAGLFHGKLVKRAQPAYQAKVRALFIAAYNLGAFEDGRDSALDAFVARQTDKQRLQFVGPDEAARITEALKDICRREGFAVPEADAGGLAARRALLMAQWQKLARQGKVTIADEAALAKYVSRKYLRFTGDVVHLDKAQLDDCARAFGRWLRAPRK